MLPVYVEKYQTLIPYEISSLSLFKFTDMFFRPRTVNAGFPVTVKVQFYMILGLASALLFVVCINFMNLATARYSNRAREVGMRKVIGAQRRQIVNQFIGESILITLFALPIGIALFYFFRAPFLTALGVDIDLTLWGKPDLVLAIVGVVFLVGCLSGSYPAFFLSAFRPVHVFRNSLNEGRKGVRFRKILVSIQYTITIALIVLSIVVNKQFSHLLNVDLGYNRYNIIQVSINRDTRPMSAVFIENLQNHPDI